MLAEERVKAEESRLSSNFNFQLSAEQKVDPPASL